jgi:hypothetical protein
MGTETLPLQSVAIERIVTQIEENSSMDSNRLLQIVKNSRISAADLESYQDFRHDPVLSYGRTKIYEGRNFSIYLMSWSGGDFTAVHNHGFTDWGAVYFFSDIKHRLYKVEGKHITLQDKSVVPSGTLVPVNGSLVHAMGNQTGLPSMSLHIYGSNHNISIANDASKVYELEKKLIRTTHGEAYLNLNEHNFTSSVEGLTTDADTLTDYLEIILPYYKKNGQTGVTQYIDTILRNPDLYIHTEFPK